MIEEEGFTEKWMQIPEFPEYWISDQMRVFSMRRRKVVARRPHPELNRNRVRIYKDGKTYERTLQSLMNKTFERIPRAIS